MFFGNYQIIEMSKPQKPTNILLIKAKKAGTFHETEFEKIIINEMSL